MPLEETYPAFADKIGKLKSMGIEETEIQPVMQSRIQNLSKMGFSVEEINKALGDVGPTTMQKVAMGPAGSAAEFAGSALSRLAPFPEVWKPDFWNKRPNETTDQQRFRNMYAISNVMPQAVTDTFEGTINQVRKVSPALARIIEDSMAALPPVAGEFASPGKLRALSGETAKPTVAAKPTPAELPAEPAFVKELAREEPTATPAAPPSPESQVDIVRQPQDRAMPGRAGVMVGERKGLPAPEEPLTAAPPNVAGVKDIVDPSKEPPGTGFVLQDYKQEQKALPMPASEMLKQRIEKIQAEHREIAAREAEITANASPPTSEIPERFQETPEKQARAEAKAQEILSKRKRGVQGSIGDAVERKIGEITDTPSKLEFKGKEFEGAVKEGKKIRLKDNPDKVLSKPDDILLVEEKIPFDVPGEGEVYYRSNVHGVNNDKYGVRYFTEEKPVAEKYAEGGEFGRAGSALTEYRGKLNTFDATKATKQEAQHILGKDGMRYLEPDGHISFEAFEYDPAIQKRLRAAGYDSIKVSEGTRGTSVAVLKDESSKLSVYISPKEAPEVSAEVVKRGQEFAGTQEQKPPITVPTARDVVQAGPKPVPSQNLSPEEIAAANEMRGMLGGRRTEPGQVRPAIRLEDGSIVTGEVGKRHDSIFSQLPKGANIKEAGWVDPEGNFMTPKEAQAYKFRSERPVNYKWGDATKTKKSILMKEPVYPKQADAALKEAAKEKVKKEPFSLSGGLIPGDVGQKIFDEGWGKLKDVANIPQKTGDLAKRVAISSNDWLHTMRAKFAPDRLPLGREAGIRLRKAGKESHFEEVKLKLETQALKNFFDRMENKGMGVLDSYERHAMDDIPPVARPYFDYFRKASDVTWKQITEKIDGLENYIENWVGHLYKGDPATNAAKIREWREARQTLTGKEGFLKDRVIPTYEVARREVGLQPLYDNPVDLMVQSLAQERKFLAHLNVVDGAMKDGLLRNITKEMPIDRATEDYLKDSRGNLLNLKGRGVLAGPKDFVRILNNYASPSKMGPFARAIMAPINFINFARVSFSAFHPNFIANADLATSTGRPLVDGLYSLFTGDGHGLKTAAGRLAKAPINPVLDYFKASHTFEALAGKEYPGAESDIALFRESGARVPSSRTSLHIGSELQRLSKLNVEPLHKMLGAALVDTVKDVAGLHDSDTQGCRENCRRIGHGIHRASRESGNPNAPLCRRARGSC